MEKMRSSNNGTLVASNLDAILTSLLYVVCVHGALVWLVHIDHPTAAESRVVEQHTTRLQNATSLCAYGLFVHVDTQIQHICGLNIYKVQTFFQSSNGT